MEYRTIDIDIDVHKCIEAERLSFTDTPNEILRRKFGIVDTTRKARHSETPESLGRSWSGKGVMLPHGTEIRMEYNGKRHFGRIDDGEWFVEDKRFTSPSAAAGGTALTRAGKHTKLDGWLYWEFKRPGDQDWAPISSLRQQAA